MQKFIIHDPNNVTLHAEQNPHLKQWVARVVKIEIHMLDDTTQEAKLTFPLFTFWSEPGELAGTYLTAWINHLTKHFIQVKSFQVHYGSINERGEEHYTTRNDAFEIPLNKAYIPKWPAGRWANPEVEKKREQKARLRRMEKNMNHGKHPVSGNPVRVSKVACWKN